MALEQNKSRKGLLRAVMEKNFHRNNEHRRNLATKEHGKKAYKKKLEKCSDLI
jgi:hypothetical protein